MSKKLNTDQIAHELAGSVFFPAKPDAEVPAEPQAPEESSQGSEPTSKPDGERASTKASVIASEQDSMIETIRKAVKHPGKDVAFVRLTAEEKAELADVLYTYKRQGTKTSETELIRIAVSFLLNEYKTNGQASVLARVLDALQA
jgi:hypothetical protein